jgi:hypothetical protein
MEILDNPFHVLRATLRDNRQKLLERSEERSLIEDPDLCNAARAALTHPKRRLAAELGWLPGLSPKRTAAAIQVLMSDITKVTIFDSLPPLARSNLYAAALPKVAGKLDAVRLIEWILGLANACEEIDVSAVLRLINDERAIAGFPSVNSETMIEDQLAELWRQYEDAVKTALEEKASVDLVDIVTRVVDRTTGHGTKHAPSLIDGIVDRYEIEAHRFLEAEAQNIHKLLEFLSEKAAVGTDEEALNGLLEQLEHVVKNWDKVAQPIQVSRMSRGQEHVMSRELARSIRDVAVEIFNERGLLDVSQKITSLVEEVFAEVLSAAEQAADDLAQLSQLEEAAKDVEVQNEEWRKEIFYEAKFGVFKNRLSISADGIAWKDQAWPLEKITRVRWGATMRYTSGIHTGTDYTIVFGDRTALQVVKPNEDVFREFTSRLFRTVGIRLMMELLSGLASGEKYRFGDAMVDDLGVELETKKFFGANERRHYSWDDLVIWSGGGYFGIGRQGDKRTTMQLSYQDDDNTHVLEAAIRMLWKKGGSRLSTAIE